MFIEAAINQSLKMNGDLLWVNSPNDIKILENGKILISKEIK